MTPPELADLHARCFVSPRPWRVAEFEGFLADPLCHLDFTLGGFVLGRTIAGEAEVLTIAVDPKLQGKGIGRDLLVRFEHAARQRNATEAFLEVAANNDTAKGLYLSAGFVQVGIRPGYYTGTDALILRKML